MSDEDDWCRPGRPWLSFESTSSCFETADGYFRTCTCPIATCQAIGSTGQYDCRLTTGVYVVMGCLFASLWILVFMYMRLSPRWDVRGNAATDEHVSAREKPLVKSIHRLLFPEDFPPATSPVSGGSFASKRDDYGTL